MTRKIAKQAPCIKIKEFTCHDRFDIDMGEQQQKLQLEKDVKAVMASWRQRLRYPYIAISWVSYGIWIAYQKMSKQILQTIS